MGLFSQYAGTESGSVNEVEPTYSENEPQSYANYQPAPDNGGGYQQPQGQPYYEQPQPQYEQQPVEEPETGRAWDIHYTPSWFVEEQQNRKNPDYEKDANWTDEAVDAIANYVSGKKDANPNEWRYGDPGWDRATQLWQETIKPVENAYQEEQRKQQAEAPKPQETQYYSFHNNNVNTTTALAVRQEGNELAPIRSADEVEKIKESSPYQLHKVDTTLADYDTLSNSGKFNQTFMPGTAGTDVKNQKWYQRWTQPVLGAVMSASGPATIAKLAFTALGGPVGLAYGIAWGGTAAYSYLKGTNVIKGNKYLDKVIELTDILDEKGAQAQGALAYGWEKAGGGDFTDWSKFGENLDFFTNNFSTIMHYAFGEGKASSEYNADVVGVVTGLTPNMGANAIGIQGQGASRLVRSLLSQAVDSPEDKIWLQRNQTTRNNVGLEGVYEIPEELLGTNAITYWLNYGQWLYDHGVTNTKQLEFEIGNAINEVYGDLSNYSEFIEHELGDPGNTMEGMQSRALGLYGQVTGDVNLAQAAKDTTGSLAMDLAGQVPGLQGLIETVGRFAGKEIRSSGGIDEVINAWDMENLQSDPSQLTARDRRISGINEDGSLKSLDVLKDPNTIKNPFARGAEKIKQLFETTPEWRASMAGDSIMNFISVGIEDALSARPNENAQARIDRVVKFVDELEHPETISSTSPFSKPSKTVLFNSIKEDLSLAIRTRRAEINKVIEDYAKLEPNRQVLNTLANALGLTPKKVLDKYESQKTVLAQMIINKADENGGKIPGIVDANGKELDVESREFGDRVIAMIAPFAGKDAKPYDPRAMMTQITTKIGDGVTETMINKYNIKNEGWVYRFGDTVKKLQQLWLLGLSPSYLANNVVNNVLTRSALGYGGFMTPKTINDWTDRFGFKPERFTESMSDQVLETQRGEQTASQKMQQAIRAERKGKHKVLDNIDSKLDWVSQHAGLFGWLSGKVEENESKQIYTSAMMTYMARTWKPGVNYRKMDSRLENLIRSQNPAMLDAIYSAINSGVNMAEIENAIYGTFVIPNIQETLVDTARKIGITDAEDVIIEMFTKGGMLAELQQALNGKRGDEIDSAITNVIKKAKAIANIQLAEDLARRADQVANDTSGYGFAEVIQLAQDMADNMADVWIASQDANTQIFDRRVREGMKTAEFRAIYQEHQKVLNERWDAVYRTVQQNYLGILNGLGFTNETTQKYIDTMRQKDALWSNFYQKTQPETIQPYLDALVWRKDDTFETWDSRVVKAWKDYTKAIKTKYNETLTSEQNLQIQMDQTFADGLRASLSDVDKGKVDSVIIPLQTKIREQRQKIVEKNRELRSNADNTNILNEKNNVYKEAQAERAELVNEYRRLQKQLYDEIRAIGPKTVASSGDSATAEIHHPANIREEVLGRRAEEAKRKAEEQSEKVADTIADNSDDTDFQNLLNSIEEFLGQPDDQSEASATNSPETDNVVHLTKDQVQISLTQGRAVPLADIDIATELESKAQTQADKDGAIQAIAQNLLNDEILDPAYQQENAHEHLTIADYIDYLTEMVSGETNPDLSEETRARVFANIQKYDSDGIAQRQIQNIKNNLRLTDIPQSGDYVASTYTFEFGEHTIVGAVFHDGELVAYVPKGMTETSVMISGDESVPVLGVSPEHPNQWVYKDGNEIYTEQKQQAKTENSFTGDAETDSLGALDPGGQAVHEMTYDNVVQILLEFASVYKTALNDAMANKTFGSLDAETKELVRQYIDNDVRTDLQNTKYKTGKFGEMMRDAALLNYSKRYGFDNALTLLFPYQFWNTRSAWNWINRMGGKGGKLWRRYARLKELEERNKKEIMPSRITGKVGIYLPFLPDWMGDALFMPTSQLSIVGNFLDPLDDWLTDDQPVIATAERYVQEAYDNGDISHQEMLEALDPAKRAGSSAWQEAYARAQTEGDHDRDLGNLFKQYFGMSLPVSIGKAIMTGNPDDWTQTPMTRTGTAFRALFGDNIVGKGLEFAMSAPERALRKAAVALTGNNDFRYQEFGNWGDYYIRNQVWDMVVEGRISAEDAIEAQAEKDGNSIWEEAADRQRQELLQKTQLLSATMPFKKMVEDVKNGNQDKLFDDFKYLMASALTMWTPATVVRDAERTWREDKAEMSQLYETGTKEDRNKFFDSHEYYQYNNLRYEDDPEQALRSYLYKSITDKWYDLDKSEQDELKLAFGTDFQRSILDKETRAYQTMDLTRLAAYAQALNGSIPYLATDALNTMNTPKINTNVIPVNEKISQEVYLKERERLYPGMSDVSNIYYNLPVEDRKIFRQANPNLTKYWEWNRTYKSQHPEVGNYSKRMTDYYNTIEAEDVFSILDPFTIKELTRAAYTKGKVDKMYQPVIERAMASAKVSDSYDDFLKVLTDYILGE